MKKSLWLVASVLLGALLIGAPAMGASLSVTSAAAMFNTTAGNNCTGDAQPGPCGLEVSSDGTTQKAFVQDQSPNGETVYRASFWFDPNDMDLGGANEFAPGSQINLARSVNTSFEGAFQVMFTVTRNRGLRLFYRVISNNNTAKFTSRIDLGCDLGVGPCVVDRVALPVRIQVEWNQNPVCADATPANFNGALSVWDVNDVLLGTVGLIDQGGSPSGVNNCQRTVDDISMGWVNYFGNTGAIPAAGSMYFDEFESFRTLAP